nr:hypothetical protein [Tanacetum cinerariifolium]
MTYGVGPGLYPLSSTLLFVVLQGQQYCVLSYYQLRFALAFCSLRYGYAFWFCVLLLEDISCVLPREDSARFKTWLRSQNLVVFCLKTSCVLSQDLLHFVSRLGCVLSQDPLRFDSRLIAFCLKTWLRFVSRLGCVLSQDLLHFLSRLTAFCLKNCCVLSLGLLRFARNLLTLQTPKKKSPADQYIFQRHTSTPTGSSGHDESSSLYAKLGLTDSDVESDEDVPGIDAGVQGEGQAGPNPDAQDEGQAGPNLDEQAEGQAGPNPGDAEASQPLPSPVVHAGLDLEHMDLDVADVSAQPHPEHMDDGFTATAYPKPLETDNEKTITETEAESMVSVTIQQDTSSIPPITTPVIDLTSRPESPNVHQLLKATVTETTTTTTTIHPPPSQPQQSSTDSMLMKRIGELEHIMSNLIQDNKHLEERLDSHGARLYTLENLDKPQQVSKAVDEVVTNAVDWATQAPLRNRFRDLPEADMKDILHQRIRETNSYKNNEDHMMLYEALEKSMNRDHSKELLKDLAEASKNKKKRRPSGASGYPRAFGSLQVPPPPPPPPSINQEGQSQGFAAPSSPKTAASAEYQAWTTTDTRLRPSVSLTPADLQIDDNMAPDAQAQSFDDEDIKNAHIPKNNWASALASTYSPPPEDSLLAQTGDITMFMEWFCKRQRITELKPQDLEGPAFELVKVFHPNVTIQSDFFFNKDLEYLRYGSKGSRPALSISKMKAAYYPDVCLEQIVPNQMWIEEECKYDIAAMYGISHWWFQRQRFYIDRHTSEGDRITVKTHMRILSVVRIKVFSMYRYDYMKKIVLRRANLKEHIIVERDFKYLYPSDFEDLYLLNLQEDFQLGIESYQTQLNLTKPRWDATGFKYKHDYTDESRLEHTVLDQEGYG